MRRYRHCRFASGSTMGAADGLSVVGFQSLATVGWVHSSLHAHAFTDEVLTTDGLVLFLTLQE